jgi:hypothetical protein
MDTDAVAARAESTCDDLGLSSSAARQVIREVLEPALVEATEQTRQLAGQINQLRAELARVGAERDRLARIQDEIAGLLSSQSREKVVHDLRNVLNELVLLRAVANELD